MSSIIPSAPFTEIGPLKEFLQTKFYGTDPEVMFPSIFAFYKVASMEELMAIPGRANSGSLSTMGACWFALFPFVDMNHQHVDVDDVFVGNDGYTILFWGRWSGACGGTYTLPNGESIDMAGKSFKNLRYAYRLTFSRETGKPILFEGLFDVAEWGRLMGSPELALAGSAASLYPA